MTKPITLGEFRSITRDLPDETPLIHMYDGMFVATAQAVISEGINWSEDEAEAETAILTGGPYDDTYLYAKDYR